MRPQLTENETRIYAAGMAAARRGENKPAEFLPVDLYRIWRQGWRRVGARPPFEGRSGDYNTLAQGRHMVRTEVETLDDALQLIEQQQRAQKSAAARKRNNKPHSLHALVAVANGRAKAASNAKKREPEGVEQRVSILLDRVCSSVEALHSVVEDMHAIPNARKYCPTINPKVIADAIHHLHIMLRRLPPQYSSPEIRASLALCMQCSVRLKREELEYCVNCNIERENNSVRVASELRREHLQRLKGTEKDALELGRLIKGVEKEIKDVG